MMGDDDLTAKVRAGRGWLVGFDPKVHSHCQTLSYKKDGAGRVAPVFEQPVPFA
jgi:hypothetical protein